MREVEGVFIDNRRRRVYSANMTQDFVTIATYRNLAEATMAQNLLEDEGIKSFLADAESVDMLWILTIALGQVKLQVEPSQCAAALKVLNSCDPKRFGVENNTEATPLRLHSPDDDQAENDLAIDADLRDDNAHDSEEDDESNPTEGLADIPKGEDLAVRAWRAAIFGVFIFPPLLNCYSLWLLVHLFSWDGELSDKGSLKALAALLLNASVFFMIFLLGLFCYQIFS